MWVLDAYGAGLGLDEITDRMREFQPDVLGISVLTPSVEVVYRIVQTVRTHFSAVKIVMGNMHASQFADEILSRGYADFIVHREGEVTFPALLRVIHDLSLCVNVPGISYRANGTVVHNALAPHIEDLDSLPYPAWDLFPLDIYKTDPRTEVIKGAVEMQILATRGCPNQCTFCSSRTERSLGGAYRMRTSRRVVDEMEFMHREYGSVVFSFMDLAFPLVRQHAIALCDEIVARGLNSTLRWTTECRVKPLDQKILASMKQAGCVRVNFGIESGNDGILRSLKKNFTVADVRGAVAMAKEAGLEVDGMFMIGLPGETEETIAQTVDLAISLDVRYAIFNIFVPYPGCELFDVLSAGKKIKFKSWSDFTSYPTYAGGEPVYVPDGLTKERLMALQVRAMKRFYLRPKFILRELTIFKFDKIGHYFEGLKGVLSR